MLGEQKTIEYIEIWEDTVSKYLDFHFFIRKKRMHKCQKNLIINDKEPDYAELLNVTI